MSYSPCLSSSSLVSDFINIDHALLSLLLKRCSFFDLKYEYVFIRLGSSLSLIFIKCVVVWVCVGCAIYERKEMGEAGKMVMKQAVHRQAVHIHCFVAECCTSLLFLIGNLQPTEPKVPRTCNRAKWRLKQPGSTCCLFHQIGRLLLRANYEPS